MRRRLLAGGAVAALVAALAGCGASTEGVAGGLDPAGRLSADGVTVVLRWEGSGAALRLAATYTPDAPGFHLYSAELPPLGVDGVGRPTRLEVGGGASAAGPAVPDRPARPEPVAGASRPVPVYPAGPVTLTVPTRIAAGGDPRAWVSYAACSATTCNPPVTHRAVDVAPPP